MSEIHTDYFWGIEPQTAIHGEPCPHCGEWMSYVRDKRTMVRVFAPSGNHAVKGMGFDTRKQFCSWECLGDWIAKNLQEHQAEIVRLAEYRREP